MSEQIDSLLEHGHATKAAMDAVTALGSRPRPRGIGTAPDFQDAVSTAAASRRIADLEKALTAMQANWSGMVEQSKQKVEEARVEARRYRAALERIESHGAGYAVGIARAALEGDQ
jgi:hypothetical protein